jgi:hypothetical protein
MLSFYKQQTHFGQIVKKKSQNTNIIFYKKFKKLPNFFENKAIFE